LITVERHKYNNINTFFVLYVYLLLLEFQTRKEGYYSAFASILVTVWWHILYRKGPHTNRKAECFAV